MNDPVIVEEKRPRRSPWPIYQFEGCRYYLRCSGKGYYSSRKAGNSLHRAVWQSANGPIPPFHDIHHVNGDRSDNRLLNLECIHESVHHSEHSGAPERVEDFRQRRAAAQAVLHEKTCCRCEKVYSVDAFNAPKSRWCSGYCGMRAAFEAGTYDIDTECMVCGTTFRKNRHTPRRTCSADCRAALISQKKIAFHARQFVLGGVHGD